MTTVYNNLERKQKIVFCKGAAEILLENCTSYIGKLKILPLDDGKKKQVQSTVISTYAKQVALIRRDCA